MRLRQKLGFDFTPQEQAGRGPYFETGVHVAEDLMTFADSKAALAPAGLQEETVRG